MLKDQRRLDAFIRDEGRAADLIPRLLTVALVGFTIFGVAATVIVNVGGVSPSWMPPARWSDGTWKSLTLAYVLGLVAAPGICLPSFYFYGLLAGVRLSMLQAVAHTVKCLAVTSMVLVGVLPIYVALALGMIVFSAPAEWMALSIGLGLALPFIAGLWGVRSLYRGVHRPRRHAAHLPPVPPHLLPASLDPGLVRLLHGRHPGDDLLALDAVRRLTPGLSPGRTWTWRRPPSWVSRKR